MKNMPILGSAPIVRQSKPIQIFTLDMFYFVLKHYLTGVIERHFNIFDEKYFFFNFLKKVMGGGVIFLCVCSCKKINKNKF